MKKRSAMVPLYIVMALVVLLAVVQTTVEGSAKGVASWVIVVGLLLATAYAGLVARSNSRHGGHPNGGEPQP